MRALLALVVVAALVGGCTDGEDAGPDPDPESTSSTSLVDYTGIILPGVGGETTTTIQERGTARLVGTVTGPSGVLAGATVRIDRMVAGRVIRHDVVTAPDGRWELRDVPGGRYRVRAFQAPTYAQPSAELTFLPNGEERSFDLRVEDQRGLVVRADSAPDPPVLFGPVNLVVLVAQRTVSADGVVRSTPLSGAFVELMGLGRWVPRGDDSGSTTGDPDETTSTTLYEGAASQGEVLSAGGSARFELACGESGDPGLSLQIPLTVAPDPTPPSTDGTTTTTQPRQTTEVVALELPACIDPESTTTTTASTTSTTSTTSP